MKVGPEPCNKDGKDGQGRMRRSVQGAGARHGKNETARTLGVSMF